MAPGDRVRLIDNPSRIGVMTARLRQAGDLSYVQVQFPEGASYQLVDSLEPAPERESPWDLALAGRFGRAVDLRSSLTHLRLTGRLANLIYSMEATNADFYAHQFRPVLKFLDSPSGGLLIADEVGLGKTIEAGLIYTELRSRHDAKKLLVLCPAMLTQKWQRELQDKFGIEARIVDALGVLEWLKDLREGRKDRGALICSMQGLRPPRGWEEDDDLRGPSAQLARFMKAQADEDQVLDLLIVDEAHYMRNSETSTAKLGRLLRQISQHVVLLSATPIHLRSQDLFQLLNLIDEDTFRDAAFFDHIVAMHEPLVRLRERLKRGIVPAEEFRSGLDEVLAYDLLGERRGLKALRDDPDLERRIADVRSRLLLADELDRSNTIMNLVSRTMKRDVDEWRVERKATAEVVPLAPVERQFYDMVTNVVRTLAGEMAGGVEGFLLCMPQRQMTSCMPAAYRTWMRGAERPEANELYEAGGEDAETEGKNWGPVVGELRRQARDMTTFQALRDADSKFRRLHKVVGDLLRDSPAAKIVLFSFFKETLRYLHERMAELGVGSIVLTGGGGLDKDSIIQSFRDTPGISLLLSSEVASEGVDLQFSSFLINYDLPWNPMRVEQRIGRIDRLGQEAGVVHIWNLFHEDTIDARIYARLLARLQIFERSLGSLEAIVGGEIQQLTIELMTEPMTAAEQEKRIQSVQIAIANKIKIEEELEQEAAGLMAHGDFILNTVRAARQLQRWNTAEDLWIYVRDFFRQVYQGAEFRQVGTDSELLFDVRLSEVARQDFGDFLQKRRLLGLTRLAANEAGYRRVQFTGKVGTARVQRLETIDQFHPIVRFVAERRSEEDLRPYGVSAAIVRSDDIASGDYAFVVQRWSIQGVRDLERLSYLLCDLRTGTQVEGDGAENVITQAARSGGDFVFADRQVDHEQFAGALESCIGVLAAQFKAFRQHAINENNDQADAQLSILRKSLQRKIGQIEESINWRRASGITRLVAADQKRADNLKDRLRQKEELLNRRKSPVIGSDDVSYGLLRVER